MSHKAFSSEIQVKMFGNEIDLNEVVLFKFERPMKTPQWSFEISFSVWRFAGQHLNSKSSVIRQA